MIDFEKEGNRHSVMCYCPSCNKSYSDIGIGKYYGIHLQNEYDKEPDKFIDNFDLIVCPFCKKELELVDRKIVNTVIALNSNGFLSTIYSCEGHIWFTEDRKYNSINPYVEFDVLTDDRTVISEIIMAADGKEFDIRYCNEKIGIKNHDFIWVPTRSFRIYPNFKFFNFESFENIKERYEVICEKFRRDLLEYAYKLNETFRFM